MTESGQKSGSSDRRSFLKIGAGVVVGAVVAGAGVAAYESSVIGSNNNSSSSVVSSLSDELNSTQSQLNDTQNALSSAQSTISTLSSQLGSTQTALGNAQSSLSAANSQNANLSSQLTTTQNSLSSANSQVASLQGTVSSQSNTISSLQGQVSTANAQVTSLQSQATSLTSSVSSLQLTNASRQGFVYLNVPQQALLAAVISTIIPTDSNGPGGATAGVIYFIDGQLGSGYGYNGNTYMKGPFVPQGLTTSFTINGTKYTGTTPRVTTSGTFYQYDMNLNQFWTFGLDALQAYADSAYGGDFQSLSAADQTKCLQDLWNNIPTTESFYGIVPADFAHELFMMVWAGFLMDPVYGGNQGMVGWKLLGFNGLNTGDFYGEGYTITDLINATTLIPLQPASIGLVQASESS